MSTGENSPSSPTHSDESPKNTIRVIKTSDSDHTLVEVKVAGESGAKVTVFGGDGPVVDKKDENKDQNEETVNEAENDKETEHLEPLTKEEIDEIVSKYNKTKNLDTYLQFFWSVDEFGFGMFTIHQLVYRLRKMGRRLSQREVARMFVDLDQDGDSLVSLDEFLDEMTREKPREKTDDEWRGLFQMWDKNQDGYVCVEDIKAVYKEKEIPYVDVEIFLFLRRIIPEGELKLDCLSFKRAFKRINT